MQKLTKKLAAKVLATVDAGLVIGIGEPHPGKMCVEAATCYAYGLPHSDRPPVGSAVRRLKIVVNDKFRGSEKERANLLRRLAIAQLGSDQIDQVEFAIRVTLLVYQGPQFAQWANNWLSGKDRTANTAYAAARAAKAAYTANAAYAAARAARAAYAAALAADAAYAARAAAVLAADAAVLAALASDAAYAAAETVAVADFSKFAEQVVQILIEMKSPGTKYLYLTERENHVSQ